jgi:hypothetical protein
MLRRVEPFVFVLPPAAKDVTAIWRSENRSPGAEHYLSSE